MPASNHKKAAVLSAKCVALLMAALISGCATYEKDHLKVGAINSDYRTKHPIRVQQSQVAEDLMVTRDMQGMSLRQRNVAVAFIGRFKRSGAETIRIIVPSGSHNAAAASRVSRDLVGLMKEERIAGKRIDVSHYHAANHGEGATIRLSFTTVTAGLDHKCGQWSEDLGQTHENNNYGNFGCATQNNLAQMIANPEDLVSPRGQSEIDATRRDNVISDWRDNGTDDLPQLLQ